MQVSGTHVVLGLIDFHWMDKNINTFKHSLKHLLWSAEETKSYRLEKDMMLSKFIFIFGWTTEQQVWNSIWVKIYGVCKCLAMILFISIWIYWDHMQSKYTWCTAASQCNNRVKGLCEDFVSKFLDLPYLQI